MNRSSRYGGSADVGRACRRTSLPAFTLFELLIVVAIIALLLAILVPAFSSVRGEAKSLLCMNNVRAIGLSFRFFADPHTDPDRGDSDVLYAPRFSAEDFLESLYQVSEFWPTTSDLEDRRASYRRGRDPILCSAVPPGLMRAAPGFSLLSGRAVAPSRLVGYAMNRRLLYAPYQLNDIHLAKLVTISERIMNHPGVPLLFDVDADAAVDLWGDGGPYFSAPPGATASIYDGTPRHPHPYWFPATRHRGRMSICFVDGHVVSTGDPLSDPQWDWEYHPPINP